MFTAVITRALLMALGYLYPAYNCFKAVERPRPDAAQLRFWCQYWMIVAVLTVLERVADPLISWFPMYCEAKLAFVVYLWYPETQGTSYVYNTFLRPLVAQHEGDVDRHLAEWKTRTKETGSYYWQKARRYGQDCFAELLQLAQSQGLAGVHPAARGGGRGAPIPAHPQSTQEPPGDGFDFDDYDVVEPSANMDPGRTQQQAASGGATRLRSRPGR